MDVESAIEYWEKFSVVAFDQNHGSFSISNINFDKFHLSNHSNVNNVNNGIIGISNCCGIFTIKKDLYEIPSIIIGNFLPRFR